VLEGERGESRKQRVTRVTRGVSNVGYNLLRLDLKTDAEYVDNLVN